LEAHNIKYNIFKYFNYKLLDARSTGCTQINLLRNNDVYIEGAVSAVEKKEYRGIHRIQEETGIDVDKILDVSIAGDKTQVTYDRYSA